MFVVCSWLAVVIWQDDKERIKSATKRKGPFSAD